MSAIGDARTRRILPLWREARLAGQTGELQGTSGTEPRNAHDERVRADLGHARADFDASPSIATAGELLSAAFVAGERSVARDASALVLDDAQWSRRAIGRLARWAVGRSVEAAPDAKAHIVAEAEDSRATVIARIAALRAGLRFAPSNAFAWVDISRLYATLGQEGRAARAMAAGVWLSPRSRFVLRSASRFYVRAGDPEWALFLLRQSNAVAADPWLLAAEIAVHSHMGGTSRHIATGRRMLDSGDFAHSQTAELGAALGTVEAEAGARKRAQRMFALALRTPNENVLAQVEYVSRLQRLVAPVSLSAKFRDAPEAGAIQSFATRDFAEALQGCWSWWRSEPFSSRPTVLGTLVASMALSDADATLRIGDAGLMSHPGSPVLLNNIAFALADAGRLDEARAFRNRLPPTAVLKDGDAVAWRATGGLIAFRSGLVAEGRALYQEAFALAAAQDQSPLRASVVAFWLTEERRAGTPEADALIDRSLSLIRTIDPDADPFSFLVRARLQRSGIAVPGPRRPR